MSVPNLISLQGRFYLAPIVAGVAGVPRFLGSVPDFEISTDADVVEHRDPTSGQRTIDFTMTKAKSVKFKGTLEEVDKDNLAYILNGNSSSVVGGQVTAKNLGTVIAGQEVSLGGYNVSAVTINDSTAAPVTVDPSKYVLDPAFGTVRFLDVTGLTMPLKADFTGGAATVTTINDTDSKEYQLTFRGINTANGSKVELVLWRTKKDASTTFPLIHEDFGKFDINGSALSDNSKAMDGALGLFGRIVTIAPAA